MVKTQDYLTHFVIQSLTQVLGMFRHIDHVAQQLEL